jgi:hypothetical protein
VEHGTNGPAIITAERRAEERDWSMDADSANLMRGRTSHYGQEDDFHCFGFLSLHRSNLGGAVFRSPYWLVFVPPAFGPIPVAVPCFGALDAVLISLTGVFEHGHDWDSGFWPWHLARPLIGIGLGVVSVLILQAGVLAVGSYRIPNPNFPKTCSIIWSPF